MRRAAQRVALLAADRAEFNLLTAMLGLDDQADAAWDDVHGQGAT